MMTLRYSTSIYYFAYLLQTNPCNHGFAGLEDSNTRFLNRLRGTAKDIAKEVKMGRPLRREHPNAEAMVSDLINFKV